MERVMGLISIIIPVYNHAHTLLDCLSMVVGLETNFPKFQTEIIIVNDGSTDNFQEVMDKVLKNDIYKSKIKKVINQENKGAPAARNRGFKEAQGEYVIFVDADTICWPHMLEQMYGALLSHPDASYVYSQFNFGWKKMKSQKFDVEDLKKNNYIDTTSLIRAKDFPGFDENLKRFQDWDLWLTMLEQGKIGIFVPQVLYKKIVKGRKGMSNWLPSLVYKLPWKNGIVKKYDAAKEIVMKKHHLN